MHLKLQKRSTCEISLVKLGEVVMKCSLGCGSPSPGKVTLCRRGQSWVWQPGPQTGSEAPFWTKFVATYVLLTGVQGLNCAPEVLSPCARDGFVGGTARLPDWWQARGDLSSHPQTQTQTPPVPSWPLQKQGGACKQTHPHSNPRKSQEWTTCRPSGGDEQVEGGEQEGK